MLRRCHYPVEIFKVMTLAERQQSNSNSYFFCTYQQPESKTTEDGAPVLVSHMNTVKKRG